MSLLKAAINNFCQGMSAHQEKKIITTTSGGKCGHDLQKKTRCNYEGRYLKKCRKQEILLQILNLCRLIHSGEKVYLVMTQNIISQVIQLEIVVKNIKIPKIGRTQLEKLKFSIQKNIRLPKNCRKKQQIWSQKSIPENFREQNR